MAMHVPKSYFQNMMKEGTKHLSGMHEAVFSNLEACTELYKTIKTCYGPKGLNKMVINHLSKLFVTNDAATIIKELEVQHPAAKMIVQASQQQEAECGDGTNFVMILAGSLLEKAIDLLECGLSPSEVIKGYEMAAEQCFIILETLVCHTVKDVKNKEAVIPIVKTAVGSKQDGYEDFLAELISDACSKIMPTQRTFNVDHVRSCKILGSGVLSSTCLQGMIFKRNVESDITSVKGAKIAVYSCPFDIGTTETKGTVLIKTAEELKNFSVDEEKLIENSVKALADLGITCVVSGGKVGDMMLHFANKFGIMVVRLMSKWDLRRLCKSINATALPNMTPPTNEEIGFCSMVQLEEVGDTVVVSFRQEREESAMSTIIIRGSTDNIMDDIERAIDDGVNSVKVLTRDQRCLPGAGATEIELAKQLMTFGEQTSGMEQYAIKKFAEAFEVFPKILAENTGLRGNEVLANMYNAHQDKVSGMNAGINLESDHCEVMDVVERKVFDIYLTKHWGIKFAVNAACTVLVVDQIIMAKQAGGPKPRKGQADPDDE